MQRVLLKAAAALLVGAGIAYLHPISAADSTAPPAAAPAGATAPPAAGAPKEAPAAAAQPAADAAAVDLKKPMPPLERVASSPKGTLKNPYTDNPEAIAEGRKLYFGKSCNGCHGGTGGGGMCPPLSNVVWVYGDSDDTLFRLVSLGSVELQKAGYVRKGSEGVVGPMPPFGELINTDQDLWKIIAWVRTTFNGGADRRHW